MKRDNYITMTDTTSENDNIKIMKLGNLYSEAEWRENSCAFCAENTKFGIKMVGYIAKKCADWTAKFSLWGRHFFQK